MGRRFFSWREARVALTEQLGPASPEQMAELARLGRSIDPATPRFVAAAILKDKLSGVLLLEPPRATTQTQMERIQYLRREGDPAPDPTTRSEAAAWLDYLYVARRRDALDDLQLSADDVVETSDGMLATVSSIIEDGRVYFDGGLNLRSWPDLLTMVARASETSDEAGQARVRAANRAASRRQASEWSQTRHHDLREFSVEIGVSRSDIFELEREIDTATTELSVQAFLAKNPQILTSLLGRQQRYCLPQQRLGASFVTDFTIGDVDSMGVLWTFVELESPRAQIHLQDGHFAQTVRAAINQINDWRRWLSDNLSLARRLRSDGGLGLADVTSEAPGLILVGRQSELTAASQAERREYREKHGIYIHTYDWLLDCLRKSSGFQGPPGANPYLIRREGSSTDLNIPEPGLFVDVPD